VTGRSAEARSRGFALIVVLWVLVLIAAIGTYILANARTETVIARNVVAGAEAEALADSGVALAVFNLLDPVESQRWSVNGEPHALAVTGGSLSIRLEDEALKINPSFATEAQLAGLFEAIGVDRSLARRLGASIADWVDRDDVPRPDGAERGEYLAAGLPYIPANAALQSLDELAWVMGMTPDILAAARPYLTVYTELAAPDPAVAPPVIRRALTIADKNPPVAARVAASENGTATDPKSGSSDGASPTIVTVEVAAQATRGGIFVRRAVVRLNPGEGKGYTVLDWARGEPAE
jgi:general secretion pathway protein K